MKKPLKKWNKEIFGHIDTKIRSLQQEISKLDHVDQQLGLDETDSIRRKALQTQLWLWLTRKERYWKQMSRCKILKAGDRNTRYFHLLATIRRRKNLIERIEVNGLEYTNQGQIKRAIVNHFKQQYAQQNSQSFNINNLGLSVLTVQQNQHLIEAISAEEVEAALANCASTKAPGYDGFNFKCIKHVWPIIGNDFTRCVLNFFNSGQLPKSINMTWVTLIPKKKDARDILDFRPISMVGCIYKVIAKILSIRIKTVMADLVGEAQTAFISGRQILDGALIANEIVSWLKKGNKEGVLLKIDFQKAYDTVNLESLLEVLKAMGFAEQWRAWIKASLSTASISVLVNGSPCKPFPMKRGLRQGDPLSPYLFVLLTEVLNCLLSKAVQMGVFNGLQIGSRRVTVTHLQFADDTLIFCEPQLHSLQNITKVLLSFQNFSGLTVNYAKSGLLVIGKENGWAENAAQLLECQIVQLPLTYLGVPLGANMRKIASWQPVIEKIQLKLSSWKAKCLSRPGKLVLIKSVLNSLPVCYLSLFKMPKGVAKEIIKLQRNFLWSGDSAGKVNSLVKWEIVQRPKNEGGLGVGDLLLKNAALLFKWWWRYTCEEGSMWRKVIQSLYDEDNVLLPGKAIPTVPGPWRAIKLTMDDNPSSKAFFGNLSIKLGNGRRVKFWQDVWLLSRPLKAEFPRLFRKSSQQNDFIANMGWYEGTTWRWTLAWNREFTLADQQQLERLLDMLQHHYPTRQSDDSIQWCKKSKLSIKDLTAKASQLIPNRAIVDSLVSTVWKNIAPPKVEFMVWLALLGKLNTRDMLERKKVTSPDMNLCSFCNNSPETLDHVLLSCPFPWAIWINIAENLGLRLVIHQNFRLFYEWWMRRRYPNTLRKKFHILAFFATAWSLWSTRNMVVFQNHIYDHPTLCHTIQWRIALWSKVWKEEIPYSTEDLVRHFSSLPILFP